MCTAVTYNTKDFYFGRTLDYEFSYGEQIVVMPRNFPLQFRHMGSLEHHFAVMGMAYVYDDYPLYYDAFNEKGLCMAGLNFVGNAVYREVSDDKNNVAQFEFISYVLSQCSDIAQARELVENINLTGTPYNEHLPASGLHWIIADKSGAITVESMADGMHIYDNPVGVLTNNPPFDIQMFNLNNYMGLSPKQPSNTFSDNIQLRQYSRGMGALGLPGDLSSQSRFVRASYIKMNSLSDDSENGSVSQFFHIMGGVDQQRGCCEVESGKYEITIYTSCCNADKGIYYYTTYNNHQINAVNMHNTDIDADRLTCFNLRTEENIMLQN